MFRLPAQTNTVTPAHPPGISGCLAMIYYLYLKHFLKNYGVFPSSSKVDLNTSPNVSLQPGDIFVAVNTEASNQPLTQAVCVLSCKYYTGCICRIHYYPSFWTCMVGLGTYPQQRCWEHLSM